MANRSEAGANGADYWKYSHPFEALSFEGVTVRHPEICGYIDSNARTFSKLHTDRTQFDPATALTLQKFDLIVGMNILKGLHVYVSYDEGVMYVSAADPR